ncbi:MAG: hypothetical protein AB2693_25075, partial [Candidatus Thiodiazotropha sp.]
RNDCNSGPRCPGIFGGKLYTDELFTEACPRRALAAMQVTLARLVIISLSTVTHKFINDDDNKNNSINNNITDDRTG